MSTIHPTRFRTIANLLHSLGAVPADRIRLDPPPGHATHSDLSLPENRRCELIAGTLVEKPVGQQESQLALWLGMVINQFVIERNLGIVSGEAGFVELRSGNIRSPDLAFFSWEQMPGRRPPAEAYPRLTPDLAVEVLSPSNTSQEMAQKRQEYFTSGTRLVWEIDPRARTVQVYTSPNSVAVAGPNDSLDGGDVLPGLHIAIADLFAELDRHG